jgi:hypothetical protein
MKKSPNGESRAEFRKVSRFSLQSQSSQRNENLSLLKRQRLIFEN